MRIMNAEEQFHYIFVPIKNNSKTDRKMCLFWSKKWLKVTLFNKCVLHTVVTLLCAILWLNKEYLIKKKTTYS